MITKNDLSKETQANYLRMLNQLGFTEEWGEVALNEKTLENWEDPRYCAFGLFKNKSFQQQVNKRIKNTDTITIDYVWGELGRLVEYVNELEERIAKLEAK